MWSIIDPLIAAFSQPHWLTLVTLLIVVVQLFYLFVVYIPLLFARKPKFSEIDSYPPISVVIAVRNEEERLTEFLPKVLNQDYPNFEVVVVDDCSEDSSMSILRAFALRHKHLIITQVKPNKRFEGGKKFALTMAIKAAQHEHLVFTDADCYPESNQWLRYYGYAFAKKGKKLVLGFGDYEYQPGWLNRIIRFDAFIIAAQYMGFANIGIPYMGVGRNMGYLKGLFFKHKGFSKHVMMRSGDDDLFVNGLDASVSKGILLQAEAKTWSVPKQDFSEWKTQKLRHLSTFSRYKWGGLFLSGVFSATSTLFWIITLFYLVIYIDLWPVCCLLSLRLIAYALTFALLSRKMNLNHLAFWYVILEPLLIVLYPYFLLARIELKRRPWKQY